MKTLRLAASAVGSVGAFHLAYTDPRFGGLFILFFFLLLQLAQRCPERAIFYVGLMIGLGCYAPHLRFFYTLFGPTAALLWLIIALYLAVFLLIANKVIARKTIYALALPFVWCALEYFRSELYYLRFSWLSAGYAVPPSWLGGAVPIGVYGVSFVMVAFAAVVFQFRPGIAIATVTSALLSLAPLQSVDCQRSAAVPNANSLTIAGVQAEFPEPAMIPRLLDSALTKFPFAELLVLSEYTLNTPPPPEVLEWCKQNNRYLIIGGREDLISGEWQNTAFVIGPSGSIVHKQGKSVPIQFFDDGRPANAQNVWNSPWGKLGIAICYDLSYTRVADELVRQGAQALIVPMMDLQDWGRAQHELHARIGPARAAEYGIPIVRIASSGISQIIDREGALLSTGTFPGQGEVIGASVVVGEAGRLPLDRILTIACIVLTPFIIFAGFRTRKPVDHANREHVSALAT